jgi:hypothetical protein
MNVFVVVIIVLGLWVVLLRSIGDLVGAAALGLAVIVLSWAYRRTEIVRPKEEKQKKQH